MVLIYFAPKTQYYDSLSWATCPVKRGLVIFKCTDALPLVEVKDVWLQKFSQSNLQ